MPNRVRWAPRPEYNGLVSRSYYTAIVNLYNRRIRQEKTQKTVAAAIGVSSRQFGRYENCEVAAPFETMILWGNCLGMELDITVSPRQETVEPDA